MASDARPPPPPSPNCGASKTEGLNLASPKGYAIALNGGLVRRDKWQSTALVDGDRVEIVRAMQGG